MAQDVFSKMGEDPWLLSEDGYLKVDTDVKEIIYHPSLNIILICTNGGIVRVLDVNSGVILQSTDLSAKNGSEVKCRYIPNEDRVLFCDGQAIGVRTDYNGVLLLDSILQKTLTDPKEKVKFELLLSEAVILKQSLIHLTFSNTEWVLSELQNVIAAVQKSHKKGIKAQKWNTACLNVSVGDLKSLTSCVVADYISRKIHTPELQVASAVKERLSELLGEQTNASDRKMMASEIRRRETFSHWPHMDYKWALPEQMAQAGFYHQPNSSGDDRAMCFTCTVCLVSWERSDEPWSEHERHSSTCPFVVGEYTQNVPISVTNATAPAIDATFRGSKISILGSSTISKLLPTATVDGLVSVFDVSGKIKRTHSFFVTQFDSYILERFTEDCGVPGVWSDEKKCPTDKKVTALSIVSDKTARGKDVTKSIRPTIVCGVTISQVNNDSSQDITETALTSPTCVPDQTKRFVYLVVYDFMYVKEQEETTEEKVEENKKSEAELDQFVDDSMMFELSGIIESSAPCESSCDDYSLIKELTSFYKTLIPGQSDAVFLPPVVPSMISSSKKPSAHSGPRLVTVDVHNSESDFSSFNEIPVYSANGPFITDPETSSISDHIVDLQKSYETYQSNKKLNYSRAIQCISLPDDCKHYKDLEIISILPTQDESHILVTATSVGSNISFLLEYSLDFTGKMVKVNQEPVIVRVLLPFEKPLEVGLLPPLDKFKTPFSRASNGIEGNAVMVCTDGAVRILDLSTLKTACLATIDAKKFVSAAYCNSLDRLCASTTEGSLHFFALNDSDNESMDEHEEDDLFGLNTDNPIKEVLSLDKLDTIRCFRDPPIDVALDDLRTLYNLTRFIPVRYAYNVVVPPCWSEFQQAMRQRRNSSILNTEAFTKTWRLQTDTTTWEEHIFEITLPATMVLGHVDVHFSLQSGCVKPCVEVALLRQTKSGIGHNKDVKFSVDDTVTIDMLRRVENPVISEEYLRAHNADILAGPVNIAHYLDLTEQSGTVTLSSPRMFRVKVRNLLLHVRAVYDKDDKKRQDGKGEKSGIPNSKNQQYLGCDGIHELSIAIYIPSSSAQLTHERTLRNLMLDSNSFVQSLISTAVNNSNCEVLKYVLDILNWIAAIRLIPNRGNNGEPPNDQLEFMFINGIEDNMTGLFQRCLLLGNRSIAHKCMNYVMTCCRGAKSINKSIGDHYTTSVLNSLLTIMSDIKQVKSAAGLHWMLSLLMKVTKKDNEILVFNKCVSILKEVTKELIQRTNPYHLLLRSRYGLYGLPTEPELFDIDPPPFVKGSSTASPLSPYVFSVSAAGAANDGASAITIPPDLGQQQAPNKDTFASHEPPPDNKLKYKTAAFPKLVKGLIESEPLHFTCTNSSEGTRLEIADALSGSVQTAINNFLPIVMSSGTSIATKKEELHSFMQKFMDKTLHGYDSMQYEKLGLTKMLEEAEQVLDQKMEVAYKSLIDYEDAVASKSPTNQVPSAFVSKPPNAGSTSAHPKQNQNHNLPWQQLLVCPPKQVIIVDRMHSGARRHVTLDFGDPVVLTDILIPACPDLVTLTIDVWSYGEEIDAVRLVTASDIGSKNLVLNDLQPPSLCQYMKITLVGRYGMSTTKCRIPLGYFYGHMVILPEEIPPFEMFIVSTDLEKQLGILSKLLEDISCRYSLACSKLKDYLDPFLVADMKNSVHLSTYISILKDRAQHVAHLEFSKIFTAYQETLTYQHQLNTVRNVISRIESSKPPKETSPHTSTNEPTSTDKLNSIAEGLLEVLLSMDSSVGISPDLCQHFFQGLCMSQTSRLQLLAAVYLEKSCGSTSFWGNFLADSFVSLFSTSCTQIFPQDRLFVLLIYLSRKSPERSAVIDAAMRVVYETLKPIESNRSLLLAVNVDLSLLSWLLMYLSLQLTSEKSDTDRWDWVLSEMVGKAPYVPYTQSDSQTKSKPWKICGNQVCWKKYHWSTPKEFKPNKSNALKRSLIVDMYKTCEGQGDPTCFKDIIMMPQKPLQYVDTAHCIAVSKILLKFIRTMDHSGTADMVLLSFKIVSKLLTLAKLQLCQLLTEDQLLELINFSLACKVPWAPFALSCFLQDALDLYKDTKGEITEMDADPTSSSWPSDDPDPANVEDPKTENAVHMEEWDTVKPKLMDNISFPPLPSVFETDSNDSDIDDVMEAFEKDRCSSSKGSKTCATSTISTSIDARLESGVCASSEIALRKLSARNTQKLLQNMASDRYKQAENHPTPWPETIGPFTSECNVGNLKMLSACFDKLFSNLQNMHPNKIENILNLWLTLNCARRSEKFDSSAMPIVLIKVESVNSLISALAWTPRLSLTTWCLGLQALTLVCNTNNNGKKWFDLSGMADVIVSHRDFVQMCVSLLSGSGVAFSEKGAAGPTLCKALQDFLVRLQVRCDIVSQSSRLGNIFKTLLLNVVYQMAKPGGPISTRMGPLDAQCKLLQSILYLDFTNIDISIGMSTLESTASLLSTYFLNIDNIKCVTMGEKQYVLTNTFCDIFASVLGTDSNKQDRPVCYEDLLISLLKLLGKLVQTPITFSSSTAGRAPMEVDEPSMSSSQTDESKAEQIHSDSFAPTPSTPFFADTVLQHHPTIISLCRCLAACKSSSLCMLTSLSQKAFTNFTEPNTVGDAVFHILSCLAKKAARKELLLEPLLKFLSETPQLSEPIIWFVLQVLDNEEAIKAFYTAGGIQILSSSIVNSSNTASTISRSGTISTVMQHFNGFTWHINDTPVPSTSLPRIFPPSGDNNWLINFAPYSTITCQSVTSQPPDILIQGHTGMTHRRARTPLWSYNYYQDETHTELLLQLPNAILLKEVQLQPHAGGLATCPSFVAIETSAYGPSRLVPACNPLPTSGLTYIRLHLPAAKVVNCVLIRLYKPRVGNSIGLLQIRLMGSCAFGKNATGNSNIDSDDDFYCNHSLGWLRLLHHCFTISVNQDLRHQLVESASLVPNLLNTCCGLLLVPSHILPVYLPCLEKVLRELALLTPENGIATIKILLDNRLSIVEPITSLDNVWQEKLMINVSGYQSACELLYQICEHQDVNTGFRVKMILDWLKATAEECLETGNTSKCNAAYVSSIASILWFSNQNPISYDLKSLITFELFETIYNLKMKTANNSLKFSLDSLLCSLCYNRQEFFPLLLQKIGVLVPNLSTDRAASISDDRKDTEGMTDDHKQDYVNSEWYNHLTIGELSELNLTKEQLETVALASRSPTAIRQLLDSGLPKLLNSAIYEFCHNSDNNTAIPMAKLEKVTSILQFFTDVCDEKMLRDWLGSPDGSSFWPHLLHWLCKKPFSSSSIQSEAHVHLEEVCVKFLAKCCLCHSTNQARLATVLCEVISQQQNGISGFLRRLILQLLLENEKVPVSIEADETLYKTSRIAPAYVPTHPAFKQTYNRTMLYLSTTTTLGDILEQHLFFNTSYKSETTSSKKSTTCGKKDPMPFKLITDLPELSFAAGVSAKDKRSIFIKDLKNMVSSTPQSKKKRYAAESSGANDVMEGRLIKCLAFPDETLPLNLNLGQLLRLMESKNSSNDWPYIHLTICQSKNNEDKNYCKEALQLVKEQQQICTALQVFSSMGGLALLAQNLPTIYPEAIRVSNQEKSLSDQSDSEWIKLEESDDIYEDIEEAVGNSSPSKSAGTISHIPPHSLTAFSLFLRLPGYAEVLLKDSKKAICLLRLMLGVTDDGEGCDIFQSSVAASLPTLPFEVLQKLYDSSPLCSDDGQLLRRISIVAGVVQLLLACLGVLTHHAGSNNDKDNQKDAKGKEDRQLYWAKGTGFGTGSTQQSWNVEQALMKQKHEEEHVTVLLQVLASYINPNDGTCEEMGDVLPPQIIEYLSKSALLPAISSYLRNDSVLDMARHIPLYKAVLKILRALALNSQLVKLLLPQKLKNGEPSVSSLLKNMKTCVDTYTNKLRVQNTKSEKNGKASKASVLERIEELEQGEGLATLMPDIQDTASLVARVTFGMVEENESDMENSLDRNIIVSHEERYLKLMKNLQFAAYDMIEEQPDGSIKFVISHHFESMAKATSEQSHPARVKRIAQETVTLSTSLPLSYSSSVFVRYDSSRLDIMKVLITGPADTPYANGCFEFDVFFPPDYPSSPMLINLETTGQHTVRFNPNLYNDGKVCLSVLNTWHGRPEEKWNAQTSSFLQVLVSIQSLILVPEPYFNEPGYERASGTPAGTANSKDYNHNVCQATVRWAMLDQILNPCPCFKDVINAHFYMKRNEILAQVEKWIQDFENETKKEKKGARVVKKNRSSSLENFKKIYKQLQEQLSKLKSPGNEFEETTTELLQEEEEDEESPITPTNSMEVTINQEQQDELLDKEHDLEKMVDDMCKW